MVQFLFEMEARIDSIAYILGMLGVPFNPYVVAQLSDVLQGAVPGVSKENIRPSAFVTLHSPQGDSLGVIIEGSDLPRNQFVRPEVCNMARPLLGRGFVSTTQETEASAVSEMFDAAVPVPVPVQTLELANTASQEPQTKIFLKVSAQAQIANQLLKIFSAKGWEDALKESMFTKVLTALGSVKLEAEGTGERGAIVSATLWSQGMLTTKAFAKAHLNYCKAGRKHDKLIAMSEVVFKHKDFPSG